MNGKASVSKELNAKHAKVSSMLLLFILKSCFLIYHSHDFPSCRSWKDFLSCPITGNVQTAGTGIINKFNLFFFLHHVVGDGSPAVQFKTAEFKNLPFLVVLNKNKCKNRV